jgi:uncharacterized protein YbjT (DUF2867 family)
MLSVLAELQRELIVANTNDGLAAARARGRVGGRRPKLTAGQAALTQRRYDEHRGIPPAAAALAGGAGAGLVGPARGARAPDKVPRQSVVHLPRGAVDPRERHVGAAVRDRTTSPVAAGDVAQVVATILRDPREHAGKVYELTGPRALDMTEVAQEFSKALGRTVTYRDVPLQWWRTEVLANAGLPQHTEQHIATMAQLHRSNRYDRATIDVERITGKRPLTVEEFVAVRKDFYLG